MLAIIGGSGLYSLGEDFHLGEQCSRQTPYGETSADVLLGRWQDVDIAFLPRHGPDHRVPPHAVNYRANLWALKQAGVSNIIAVNAVGGISTDMAPAALQQHVTWGVLLATLAVFGPQAWSLDHQWASPRLRASSPNPTDP